MHDPMCTLNIRVRRTGSSTKYANELGKNHPHTHTLHSTCEPKLCLDFLLVTSQSWLVKLY